MPNDEMSLLLRGLAQKVDDEVPTEDAFVKELVERVLRECGLLRLLEAGDNFCCGGGCYESKQEWAAAKAAMKERTSK